MNAGIKALYQTFQRHKAILSLPLQRLIGQYCASCQQYSTQPLCWSCLESITKPPHSCRVCGYRLLTATTDSRCKACLEEPPAFEAMHTIGIYQDRLAELIIAAKVTRQVAAVAALRYLLQYAIQNDAETRAYFKCHSDYVLLAMPTPISRLVQRGFNLPRWFAVEIAKHYNMPILPSRMAKLPFFVRKQALLSKQQRQKNRHFYQINHSLPPKILIVDDILTTGETLHELAKKLRQNGAESVVVYTIARGQFD